MPDINSTRIGKPANQLHRGAAGYARGIMNTTTARKHVKRILAREINIGDKVQYTDEYNRVCTGWMASIAVSPYINECGLDGSTPILRGYVVVEDTDYSKALPGYQDNAVGYWALAHELTLLEVGYKEVTE